ncbi:MAG TPA: MoxR family ATPase [Baekduia sp.]|nr:MoxR family ATPase [Baekduia sp.]
MDVPAALASIADVETALRRRGYLPDEGLATAVFLAVGMRRPLLVEGEAGVGKTQLAKTLADVAGAELIRLQCYEGIDAPQALYEWDYARQLLTLRASQGEGADAVRELYLPELLAERPLLRAIRRGAGAVLLIDELDRADEQFEAFLLEVLSDYTISIPELGTVRAETPPLVLITSNRTRELHDALKRRCLFHWIEYPHIEREIEIIMMNAPEVSNALAMAVAGAVERLRAMGLSKAPGPAEAIDWARGVALLGEDTLSEATARATLGWAVKNRDDLQHVSAHLGHVVGA